jgi:hypothetical protein
VDEIVRTAADFLRLNWSGQAPRTPEWAAQWAKIASWADDLSTGHAEQIDLTAYTESKARNTALTFLLNAAWVARVPAPPAAQPSEAELDVLASATVTRMLELKPPRGRGSAEPNSRS